MPETSRERVARNQSAYRKVNEGIRAGHGDGAEGVQPFVCECAILGCNKLVELTVAEYEEIRSKHDQFVIFPGHEVPDAEDVVSEHDDVMVVEKHDDLAPITRSLDPRTD